MMKTLRRKIFETVGGIIIICLEGLIIIDFFKPFLSHHHKTEFIMMVLIMFMIYLYICWDKNDKRKVK